MGNLFTTFVNCRLCINGQIVEGEKLVVSQDSGLILKSTGYIGGDIVDLDDRIVAPGFLDVHCSGADGVRFDDLVNDDKVEKQKKIDSMAQSYAATGVTGFLATVPPVESALYAKILPSLMPKSPANGASLLGVHLLEPHLHPSQQGTRDARALETDSEHPKHLYGDFDNSTQVIKLATVEVDTIGSTERIKQLKSNGIVVSLGHTSGSYEQGLTAVTAGATCLTRIFDRVSPLNPESPGLAGLIALPGLHSQQAPYFTMVCDGTRLHASIATLAYRANPRRAILVSDNPVDGSSSIGDSVRRLKEWSNCSVAEAVATVTDNVADMLQLRDRGKLEEDRRGDFVIMDDDCNVIETWIAGFKVWGEDQ